jgi:hypothetical protein
MGTIDRVSRQQAGVEIEAGAAAETTISDRSGLATIPVGESQNGRQFDARGFIDMPASSVKPHRSAGGYGSAC